MATFYAEQGSFPDAKRYYQQALGSIESDGGKDAPALVDVLNDFAWMLRGENELSNAEMLLNRASEILHSEKQPDLIQWVRVSNNLGILFTQEGRYAEAENSARFVLKIEQQEFGVDNARTYEALINVADLCEKQSKRAETESFLEQALHAISGQSDSILERRDILERLRDLYREEKKAKEAEHILTKLTELHEASKDVDPTELVDEYVELANIYGTEYQYEDEGKALARALQILKVAGKPEDLRILDFLGFSFMDQKKFPDAEHTFQRELEVARAGKSPADLTTALNSLSLFYFVEERYSEAEPLMKEWIAIMEQVAPSDKNIEIMRSRLADVEVRLKK